eukprot:COSAG04_NODE_1602_length_6190_cov_2.412576_6_plen_38_part_00
MTDPRLHPKEVAGYLESKLNAPWTNLEKSGGQLRYTA